MWEQSGAFPYLCTGRHTHTHTHTHAQTHGHGQTCERAQETHQHNTLTCMFTCAHVCTHVTQPCSTCLHKTKFCVPVHTQKDTHAHTHTFITHLNATQSRCGVSIPPEASPLPLSGLALTCTSMHVSVSLLTSHPCVSQLRSWVQRVGPRVSGKTTLESLCRHPL